MTSPAATPKAPATGSADLTPPLKWAGGKRWLLPVLEPTIGALVRGPGSRRLVEPFAGGLAVALGLRPTRALLNDINPFLINLYRWMQRGIVFPAEPANTKEEFYARRTEFNALVTSGDTTSARVAELFYWLNRTCFNGLCRFNSSGGFNVPWGRGKTTGYRADLSAYAPLMSGWTFALGDFTALRLEPTDLLYLDPPYDTPFTKYAKEDFNWDDQVRLVDWAVRHSGPVVISNEATERVIALYTSRGFTITRLSAPRRIAANGSRDRAVEVLATRGVTPVVPAELLAPTP